MAAATLGLFGGTFDPIHFGHLLTARSVLEQLQLSELCFVPSAQPPHKGDVNIISFSHRAAMVKLGINDETGLTVDECEGKRDGPSYTLDTVKYFRELKPDVALYWIIGADSLADLHTWYHVDQLVDACEIITACRPGWEQPDLTHLESVLRRKQLAKVRRGILETPRIDISATDIRGRAAESKSIRYQVPEAVREYIDDHQLYRQ